MKPYTQNHQGQPLQRALCTLLAVLSLVLLSGGCAPVTDSVSPIKDTADNDGIYGGFDVSASDAIAKSTVFVAIQYPLTGTYICTGSLIERNLVVLAAHCFFDKENNRAKSPARLAVLFTPTVDMNRTLEDQSGQEISFDNVRVNPSYLPQKDEKGDEPDDIALIRLSQPPPAPYAPVKLLNTFDILVRGQPVKLAGFGLHDDTNKDEHAGHYQLRMETTTILESPIPKFRLLPLLGTIPIAKVQATPQQHVDCGDSGGPAFVTIRNELYLWGINKSQQLDHQADWITLIDDQNRDWLDETITELTGSK